jgi:hypothetical protein
VSLQPFAHKCHRKRDARAHFTEQAVAAARAAAHHDFCVLNAARYECCVQQCSATFVCTEHYRQHWQSGVHNDAAVHADAIMNSGVPAESIGEVSIITAIGSTSQYLALCTAVCVVVFDTCYAQRTCVTRLVEAMNLE